MLGILEQMGANQSKIQENSTKTLVWGLHGVEKNALIKIMDSILPFLSQMRSEGFPFLTMDDNAIPQQMEINQRKFGRSYTTRRTRKTRANRVILTSRNSRRLLLLSPLAPSSSLVQRVRRSSTILYCIGIPSSHQSLQRPCDPNLALAHHTICLP